MPDDYYVSQYSGEEIDALLGSAGAGAVRYDAAQTLTDAQKTQARANIAAAPDGFGLGSAIVYAPENSDGSSDANLIDATGFYLAFANAGSSGWNYVFHMQYPSDAALQFSSYVNDTTYRIRKKILGVWQPWEWVNPSMLLGVEYRTTERYRGKPVYQKLIDFGALPNNTQKNVSIFASGEANTMECGIDVKLISYENQAFKGVDALATQVLQNGNVSIVTKYDLSESSVYALCYYTKTTD